MEINRSITRESGAEFGIINVGNLEFIVEKAMHTRNVFRKAADFLCGISRGHPFLDGNKRTAFEAARMILKLQGVGFKVGAVEAEEFMVNLASSESLTVKEAELWIRGHSD